jgi:hypothetical protein
MSIGAGRVVSTVNFFGIEGVDGIMYSSEEKFFKTGQYVTFRYNQGETVASKLQVIKPKNSTINRTETLEQHYPESEYRKLMFSDEDIRWEEEADNDRDMPKFKAANMRRANEVVEAFIKRRIIFKPILLHGTFTYALTKSDDGIEYRYLVNRGESQRVGKGSKFSRSRISIDHFLDKTIKNGQAPA